MTADADMRSTTAARHEEVLGQPPRVAPLNRELIADQVTADTQHIRGAVLNKDSSVALDAIPEIMFTMCRVPSLWRKLMDITIQIQGADACLPLRDRKLAILRVGWLCQAPYEFGEHVNQAKRAGITSEEVSRIIVGSSAPEWNAHDRAVVRAAEELHEGAMVSDATWHQLARRLDENQIIELLVLIGQFTATAYFQNSLRLRLESGNQGLEAR